MVSVSELASSRYPVTIAADASIVDALHKSRTESVSHLIVTEGRRLVGICCVCELDDADTRSSVRTCMNANPTTIGLDADIAQAVAVMSAGRISCLPVVARGELYGVITRHALRQLGLLEPDSECCDVCGSAEHVRRVRDTSEVALCLDCSRKSQPPDDSDELGGDG
jgi:predicted transcriptional regulator